ncbi:hypothetical protein [Vibrio mediterranei]|uniref:Uncharacterized protein n=1 Tax=Vibrio mediterranei TaxID=689 RepID=A0AAN1FHM8_9VIBR|nr:hypothetical protein [Vibrio mediterranei]ASI90801.1 hypothetical protein BSZ05_13935 [Vibrio mediterranei]
MELVVKILSMLDHRGTWTLLGLLMGFSLNTYWSYRKELKNQESAKLVLLDELRFNSRQSEDKIEILKEVIDALKVRRFLSPKCPAFSTIEFKSQFCVALPKLTTIEKDNLRHLHNYYVQVDELLSKFEANFKEDIDNADKRDMTAESIYSSNVILLENIENSLQNNLKLAKSTLDGNPIDVFNHKMT